MKTVLAITAYNCAPQLDRVLASFDQKLAARFSDILVIDNISPDDTATVALSYKKKIKNLHVLRNKQNYSLGGSHKVAFLYAEKVGATHVAILHGDDQAVAAELHELLDIAESRPETDAVLGTRFMKGSRLEGYDWKRIAGNRVLNIAYTILTGRRCRDLGSGLNVFRLGIFKDHTYLEFADRLTFNFELLLYLIGKKAKLVFYPITWRESDQVSNARNFNIAKIALINLFKWRFGLLRYRHTHQPADYVSEELS
jgi:dolichol-phosphate mannosyltransferase